MDGELADGYYFEPTVLKGHNDMRVFQEEIFGPVLAVTTFKDEADAVRIANDTLYGLGAGVWTRNGNLAYRMGRAIKAGRVWTNCYHLYPAGAAFGGYKISGVGRENHQMMLEHYSQTKNLLVSYSDEAARVLLGRRRTAVEHRDGAGPSAGTARVVATPAAARGHRRLRRSGARCMFFQSGGCCDGSLPMCFDEGEFVIGDRDVLLGNVGGLSLLHRPSPVRGAGSTRSSSSTSATANPRGSPSPPATDVIS